MTARIQLPHDEIADFCQRHHIRKLALFGSALRNDFTSESDVDMLVEFEPDSTPGYFGLVRMERELSAMIGRKVDLRTPGELSRYFRQQVIDEAQTQYERN